MLQSLLLPRHEPSPQIMQRVFLLKHWVQHAHKLVYVVL